MEPLSDPRPVTDTFCAEKGIPTHLHQNGRGIISTIGADERVYRRKKPGETNLRQIIKFDRMSVCLATECNEPKDCLYIEDGPPHKLNYDVIEIPLSKLQSVSATDLTGAVFSLKLQHDPKRCIFPHAEVVAYKDGKELAPKSEPSATAKQQLRELIVESVTTVHPEGQRDTFKFS